MKNENYLITEKVKGDLTGKKLFVVVTIDQEDSEDSTTELWRANDEDHLQDLVKEEYVGDEFGDDEEFFGQSPSDIFDEDWGFSILVTEIGKAISKK
jgi:hypothetical protein